MAKIIKKKKGAKKEITKQFKIDGTAIKIKSDCVPMKTDGLAILNDKNKFAKDSACSKCRRDCKPNCLIVSVHAAEKLAAKIAKEAAKGTRVSASKRPFGIAIKLWLKNTSKENIIKILVSKHDMGEKPAKRFVADIFSVGEACKGNARKQGGLIDSYCTWAVKKKGKGEAPTGCKITLGFCRQFCIEYNAAVA